MRKILVILLALTIATGALPASLQARAMTKLLPGRWMLYAGGGTDIWEFHEDGTCVAINTDFDGKENTESHTWRVEPATEEDLKNLWAQPDVVLVIDGRERFGLHLTAGHLKEAAHILAGGWISEEERAQAAAVPLCISITFWEGGGGYVRMKNQ